MSLVFYDTETTGTATFFDQILQFAAIRTDERLREIGRFEMRCRLLPHVVPAPEAMRVTQTKVAQLIDGTLPSHYEMMRAVRAKLLAWSPALFLGWNSIKFDEDLLRQALYKTLHNPYLTNSLGNSRSDALRIAQACSIYAPMALTIPVGGDGRLSFKLEEVARANGYAHDRAHDAMADVEATVFLCRGLVEQAPLVWSTFMRFSTKAAVADYISTERIFCVSDFFYGRPYSYLGTVIGQNQKNNAEWYVYDLSVDPDSLQSRSSVELSARLDESPRPVRRLKANAVPMLFSTDEAPENCRGRECGLAELERRAGLLEADPALGQRLISALESTREEYPPSPHVEKQIYDRFIIKPDEILMDIFHAVNWIDRSAIVERFEDPRLRTIGRQLLHFEQPQLLAKAIREEHDRSVARRLLGHGEDVSWLTLPCALAELEGMLAGAEGAELEFLREHDQFLRERQQCAIHATMATEPEN